MARTIDWRDQRSPSMTAGPDERDTAPPTVVGSELSTGASLYVDLLRLVAAILVFIGHADAVLFNGQIPGLISHHAREAVAIFFVLSGFVITFATVNKERSLQKYAVARASRILPVVIVSLAVTLLCDKIGYSLNASFYENLSYFEPHSLVAALSYITFTNQIWFSHIVFGTNEPFWSLSFEVWYYLFFAILIFPNGLVRLSLMLVWAVVAGPVIFSYLPLWLIGAVFYILHARGLRLGLSAFVLFPVSIFCYQLARRHLGAEASDIFHVLGPARSVYNVAYFCLIGLIACVNILSGGEVVQRLVPHTAAVGRWIRWAAGASFTLYLVHLPILVMLRAVFPTTGSSAPLACLACAATLAVVVLLAELGERRKKQCAEALTRLAGRV